MPDAVPGKPPPPVRDAATVILLRDGATPAPRVLMGRRRSRAAFMPDKFVFPGGAVDAGDGSVPLAGTVAQGCLSALGEGAGPARAHALQAAAIRELWEETGLVLGVPGTWPTTRPVPDDWAAFAATGHLPDAAGFRFVFRAITPPGRPRRFDARFFLVDAGAVQGDPDDFSRASGELSHLQWMPLEQARGHDLPFITRVVLAEVAGIARSGAQPGGVPFYRNDDNSSVFLRLEGSAPAGP